MITKLSDIEKRLVEQRHPMQPIEFDSDDGTPRFKGNAIIKYLLELARRSKTCDMDLLGMMPFSIEDRQQFAQLIGYTLCGYLELPYVENTPTYDAVLKIVEELNRKE